MKIYWWISIKLSIFCSWQNVLWDILSFDSAMQEKIFVNMYLTKLYFIEICFSMSAFILILIINNFNFKFNCPAKFLFVWPWAFFHFMSIDFPLEVLYPEHLQLAFDFVIIACILESIRPGLALGCKAPNGVGLASLITSSESGLVPLNIVCTPLDFNSRPHHWP